MTINTKTYAFASLSLLLLAAPGCKDKKADAKAADKVETPAVRVLTLTPSTITRTLRYDADLRGEREVKVYSQVPERIVQLKVQEGERVRRGQVLAVVRAGALAEQVRSAAAALVAARADRDALKLELERARKLLEREVTARSQVDQLEARFKAAEAQIQRLKAMQGQASIARQNATIRSPMDGVLAQRFLEEGDMTAPSLPVFTVVQMDRLEVDLQVPEKDLADIRKGMTARISVARYPDQTFSGTVIRIAPMIDRITRTAEVKISLDNPEQRLLPGMLARVELEVERKEGVVVVPYDGLVMEMGARGEVVFRAFVLARNSHQPSAAAADSTASSRPSPSGNPHRTSSTPPVASGARSANLRHSPPPRDDVGEKSGLDGKRVHSRLVKAGIIAEQRVEVVKGLKLGEVVVVRGQHLLEENAEVRVTERLQPDGTVKQVAAAKKPGVAPAGGANGKPAGETEAKQGEER